MDTKVARHLRALRWHGIYGHSGGTAFMDTKVARHYIFYTSDTNAIYSGYTVFALPVHCQDRFLNIAPGLSGEHIFGK